MRTADFNYELPEDLIAQVPLTKRHMSRLMVVDRNSDLVESKLFLDVAGYLDEGDCLVLNNTRVMPARLLGNSEDTGGKIEFVCLKRLNGDIWEVILKPGRRAKVGKWFVFGSGELRAEIIDILDEGNRLVRFEYDGVFENILDKVGVVPLPPYITTKNIDDPERYQTVYSKIRGSAAAPTAGLHFTYELLEELSKKRIRCVDVTLHVGLGTFRPVKSENILEHKMHSEYYSISQDACSIINQTKTNNKRIIAVGTTSCRVLETVGQKCDFANKSLTLQAQSGYTDIFIYPGYKFKVVDALITNFHLSQSTLIMLVSAFAGRQKVLDAYKTAIKERYRFFSFGDAMLIK